jgi:hypothetical protein
MSKNKFADLIHSLGRPDPTGPVTYAGKHYPSATEARWAAYFAAIGCRIKYARRCFNNGSFVAFVGKDMDTVLDRVNESGHDLRKGLYLFVVGRPKVACYDAIHDGRECMSGAFTRYGFTRKGWYDPYFTDCGEGDFPDSDEIARWVNQGLFVSRDLMLSPNGPVLGPDDM